MSYKTKELFTVLVLLAVAVHLNCGSLNAKEATGYSRRSIYDFNLADQTRSSRGLRSAGFESNATNSSSSGRYNETLPLEANKHMYEFSLQPNDSLPNVTSSPNENSSLIRRFHKRAFHTDARFQADSAAFEGPGTSGNMYISQQRSNSEDTDLWLVVKPSVHCSGDAMTLTAQRREYTHILVDRADASPVHLYQLPAYCGYTVRVTWKELVLMAPFDGCYITQENGFHVLSLLWWGKPIKISCPMIQMTSQPTPSVICSYFGMIIQIEGAQDAVEKHRVKVNGEVLPLISKTCAYRINSPPDVVVLHTAFTSRCVISVDGENRLVIFVDGKQFILSCPHPQHLSPFLPNLHSPPFYQQPKLEQKPLIPHVPTSFTNNMQQPPMMPPKPEKFKPPMVPHFPYRPLLAPQFYPDHSKQPLNSVQGLYPFQQKYPPSIYQQPKPFPVRHQASSPISHGTQHQAPIAPYHPVMPPLHYSPYQISCPPHPERFCSQSPVQYPQYHQTLLTPAAQPTIQPMREVSFVPQPTYVPPPPVVQNVLFPQLPIFPSVPPEQPPKISSPSLSCIRNKMTATLPYAQIDSIKVKDTKTNTWISIAAVSAACNYKILSRGGAVVLSSPLPACHTQQMSSSMISLYVRFWDSSLLRARTLQLQCRYLGDVDAQSADLFGTPKPLSHHPARPTPEEVQVFCSSQHMSVRLPPGPTSGLVVEAPSSGINTQTKAVPLLEAPSHCGYSLKRNREGAINIHLPYSSCHMTQQDGQHKIILQYQTLDGRTFEVLLSCQASVSQECNVAIDQQLVCGSGALSSTECYDKGCCFSLDTQLCFYPMDECTVDRHFVFSVHSSLANPPFSPATLVTAGNSSCSPHKVTADFALFKIPLDECGVHRYEVGKTVIYMVEILNRLQSVSLNYGTITRDSPVRLLVECRYFPGSVVSLGYLVKSPSLGPSIKAQGVFGVQLRIAKGEHYNDFYPQYHQPLRMLLGKPLYLEVRLLNPPDPTAMLLVHYCVAYPRSAKSAWILIYDGCPNSLDKTSTPKPPATPAEALINHVRRFTITTFQFLHDHDVLQTDEEIYFMCSTEVCLPSDGPCIEGCFEDPANVKS
nr:uncharacterized protein LOC129444221 [Misgurnus anguillicaudatus]